MNEKTSERAFRVDEYSFLHKPKKEAAGVAGVGAAALRHQPLQLRGHQRRAQEDLAVASFTGSFWGALQGTLR